MRKAGRGGGSWGGEDHDANLVEGPLLVCVLRKLVNEGVQLLWDDHTISRVGSADVRAVAPPSTSETSPSPSPQAPLLPPGLT